MLYENFFFVIYTNYRWILHFNPKILLNTTWEKNNCIDRTSVKSFCFLCILIKWIVNFKKVFGSSSQLTLKYHANLGYYHIHSQIKLPIKKYKFTGLYPFCVRSQLHLNLFLSRWTQLRVFGSGIACPNRIGRLHNQ